MSAVAKSLAEFNAEVVRAGLGDLVCRTRISGDRLGEPDEWCMTHERLYSDCHSRCLVDGRHPVDNCFANGDRTEIQ